jgi:hypothetical protein
MAIMLIRSNKPYKNSILWELVAIQMVLLVFTNPTPVQSRQTDIASANPPHRVNIPYFSGDVIWAESAIFWFGVNDQGAPGRNYVDIRMAYTADGLYIQATVVDYYLWYKENPSDDLTLYDGISIYLDTNHDRAASPQTDDYTFFIGARQWQDMYQYMRQGRGTGTGWDSTWTADWNGLSWMQWWDNGPNDNSGSIDFGWVANYTIPWDALNRSGPPDEGAVWGLGVQLHDRDDQPPAGYIAPEPWPETLTINSPATWGELNFGYADYQPPAAIPGGTTVVQAASPTDNTVEDSWMGGGGTCGGGHEGGSDTNHGNEPELFVGSQTAPTDFPCFNKSYLRFSLDSIPAGKVIISATLTLHLWGNAGAPGQAQPSWVSLFTITDPWEEMGITWNNAPLAQENVSASWVYPIPDNFAGWPGIPYYWDTTQAVAEAYALGIPVSMAIYDSSTEMHSSKYLTSSEAGDWDVEGRPKLTVVWGDPPAMLNKQAAPSWVTNGDMVTYTLSWLGIGQSLTLTDTLPTGLSDPDPLIASSGTVTYDAGTRIITWTGTPGTGQPVTITYTVTVDVNGPRLIRNSAFLVSPGGSTTTMAAVCVDCYNIFLPKIMK